MLHCAHFCCFAFIVSLSALMLKSRPRKRKTVCAADMTSCCCDKCNVSVMLSIKKHCEHRLPIDRKAVFVLLF